MAFYTDAAAMTAFPNLTVTNNASGGVYIGEGCEFGENCHIRGDNSAGDDFDGWPYRGPAVIGDNNTFGIACEIAPGTTIGDNNWFGGECYFWGFPTIGNDNRCENMVLDRYGEPVEERFAVRSYCYFWNGCVVGDENIFGSDSYVGLPLEHYPPEVDDEPWGSSSVGSRNRFCSNSYVWAGSSVGDNNLIGPEPGIDSSYF
jgi:NDP-sugar pyrophosphorylase family protein